VTRTRWPGTGPPLIAAAGALVALVALVAMGYRATPSSADGDPASDVLPVRDVFFPYQPNVSPSLEAAAEKTVHAAGAAGFSLKVAIIGTPLELGLVRQLWRRPQAYAEFLDREISFNEPKKLLVVMPNGFGVVPAPLARALARVPIDTRHGSDGLTRSAILAVVALARSQGHPVSAPSLSTSSSRSSPPALLVFGLPAALLALVGVMLMVRGRRRRSGPEGRER
jgi:hypothetical protein